MNVDFFKKNNNSIYVLTGNFFEYFDLYMYVHLAHIINQYYFIETDTPLLNAFMFANRNLFPPLGCIIFAYLGDTIGRRKVIVSTSILMAFCSSTIGFLPTHEDIGAFAGVFLIFLRVLQGISLSGEPLAARVYLVESTPDRYGSLAMTLMSCVQFLGGTIALGLGYLAISIWGERVGWRVPFYCGSFFCFFSLWLRWHLAESKEFLDYTAHHKKKFAQKKKLGIVQFYASLQLKHPNVFCILGIACAGGFAFGCCYVYFGRYLTSQLGLTDHELLLHNFRVSLLEVSITLFSGILVVVFNLNIKKFVIIRTLILSCLVPFCIFILNNSPSLSAVFLTQIIIAVLFDRSLIYASLIKTFGVIGRFSLLGFALSVGKIIDFFLSGIVFNYVLHAYGMISLLTITFPMAFIFLISTIFHIPYAGVAAMLPVQSAGLKEKKAA